MVGPWEAMSETQMRPPPIWMMSVVGPLRGEARDPGAPTTYPDDVDGGPLTGDDGDPGVLTTYPEDVDGGPRGR
jgi:hypothetical protein